MSSSIKNSIFIFILLTTFLSSSSYNTTQESPIEKRYKKWLTRYGNLRPSNLSNMDLKKRFEIYKDNVQFIDKFNSENHSFTLIDNKFADMTPKEFKAKFLNEKAGNHTHLKRGSYRNHLNISQETSCPASWNWVAKGVVGPVKDQTKYCGKRFNSHANYYLTFRLLCTTQDPSVLTCSMNLYTRVFILCRILLGLLSRSRS